MNINKIVKMQIKISNVSMFYRIYKYPLFINLLSKLKINNICYQSKDMAVSLQSERRKVRILRKFSGKRVICFKLNFVFRIFKTTDLAIKKPN